MIGPRQQIHGGAATPQMQEGMSSVAASSAPVAEQNRTASIDFPAVFGAQGRRASDRRREVNPVLQLYTFGQTQIARLRRDEGQTMAEYAVVLAVVTLLVIGAITLLSTNIGNEIKKVAGILVN
jgi:Flp pilus assembly pilin Flp